MAKTFVITADSKPLLDTWGWADYWAKEDWRKWVNANVTKYGKVKAREKFVQEWGRQDMFADPYNWAKYDKEFVSFLKKAIDVDISSIISGVAIGTQKAIGGVSSTVGNIGDSLGGFGKNFKIILIIIVALLLIAAAFFAYQKIKKLA